MGLLETECEQFLWPQQLLRCGRSYAWTPRRCLAALPARCQRVRQIPRKLPLAPPAIGRSSCPGNDTESCAHCGHTNTCAECQLAKLLDGYEPIPVPTDLQTRPLQLCKTRGIWTIVSRDLVPSILTGRSGMLSGMLSGCCEHPGQVHGRLRAREPACWLRYSPCSHHCCAPVHAILPSDADFQADPRREPDVASCPFIVAFFTIGEHGHPALSLRGGRAWRPHGPGPR